jgi:GTP-dependent phosphoenolpyruvate carboxykinase
MSALAGLKLVAAKRSAQATPAVQRRTKLLKKIAEQIALAKARAEGRQYTATRMRNVKDAETGVTKAVEMPKRVREWWWTAENGKTVFALRYGAKSVEFAKGKMAVEVGNGDELIAALDVLKRAVEAGELDAQIESASTALRAGFKK